MGDAYEPIGGLGDAEPMVFAPPPPLPPPPPAAKTKGESYVPLPPQGSEVSKSQIDSNIGTPSGISDPNSAGDFIQSTKTRHGNMDEMGTGNSTGKKKKPNKSFKKCCIMSACVTFAVGLVATFVMTLLVLGLIKF